MPVPKLLIDGYNVLFQSQLVGRGRGRNWLPAARQRLVQLLESRLGASELLTTQVVFDAPQVGPAPPALTLPSGLSICYAIDHEEADDLLEQIMREHPTPKLLTVVSSDLRIRRCARAQRAVSMDAQRFLDQLERRPSTTARPDTLSIDNSRSDTEPVSSTSQTPSSSGDSAGFSSSAEGGLLSQAEVDYWLEQFAPHRELPS